MTINLVPDLEGGVKGLAISKVVALGYLVRKPNISALVMYGDKTSQLKLLIPSFLTAKSSISCKARM